MEPTTSRVWSSPSNTHEATSYDELKQVMDAGVKLDDLVVIDFNREGTAMLEDGIFVTADWLREARNKQIAARLRISAKTVEHHVEHIYEKTEIRSRPAAAMFAVKHGLVAV